MLLVTMGIVEHVRGLDQIEQRTPEWYAARENMITASDMASVLGVNPYKSRNALLKSKVEPVKQYMSNFATEHGNKYEDEARLLFGEMYGLETWDVGLFRHSKYKWLGGSPDGIASDGALLEIKCPVKREIKHEIPVYYYPQVQICMEVLDIPKCYFIQYKPETIYNKGIIDVVEIPRSKVWFQDSFEQIDTFWKDVLKYRESPELMPVTTRQYKRKEKEPRVPEPCLIVSDTDDDSDMEDSSDAV